MCEYIILYLCASSGQCRRSVSRLVRVPAQRKPLNVATRVARCLAVRPPWSWYERQAVILLNYVGVQNTHTSKRKHVRNNAHETRFTVR